MTKKIQILIADDSKIFSQGLALLLEQYPEDIGKVQIAHNYLDTLRILEQSKLDILILDLNFETAEFNGFTIAAKVKEMYSKIKIIILTQQAKIDNYDILFKEIEVDGYLDKQLGLETTMKAIQEVFKGEKYVDENIKKMLEIGKWMNISKREKEVVELLRTGALQKEIAGQLFISPRTVESHIKNLTKKMKAKNTTHLIAIYSAYKNANRENSS